MWFDYATYKVIWWVLVGIVLVVFAITAGFDLGIGTLLPFIARRNEERRVLVNVMGPTWDGNQVWLIFGGGALFAVWPQVYAVSFSGMYIAVLFLLFSLFLRPVGFEYRAKIHHATWQTTWDWLIFFGSFLPALIIGVALGNVMRGLPFHFDDTMRMFYTGNVWQLFTPFTVVCGLVSVAMLLTHGANLLQMRTEGVIHKRCKQAAIYGAIAYVMLFAIGGAFVLAGYQGYKLVFLPQQPLIDFFKTVVQHQAYGLSTNYSVYPAFIAAPIIGFAGALIVVLSSLKEKGALAFIGSILMIAGTIFTFGFSLFPFVLPSITDPSQSLTVWNAASSHLTLQALFISAIVMLPIIALYTLWVYKTMWGKVTTDMIKERGHELY
jgi:cytochrome d ubiquinol oxidase subunit II